ncbi:MAG TPA: hypothetical protein VGF01_03955 [Terracidiphilus sp.]|jgi:hypothetical protein
MLKNQVCTPEPAIPLLPRISAVLAALCLLFCTATTAAAQTSPVALQSTPPASAVLPDAPQPLTTPRAVPSSPPVPFLWGRLRTPGKPLTLEQKFKFYAFTTFGPPEIVMPAIGAGIRMAHPNSQYPPSWRDGMGAYGRLYGSTIAAQTSKHTAEFVTEAAFHYDARYYPSHSDSTSKRILHALEYVALEKTDSGKTSLAVPHFAAAAAGGFVGMAYMPPGYNTLSEAGKRSAMELATIFPRNLAQEFAPELAPLLRHIHIPKVIPVWWTPIHRPQPDATATKP